MSIHLDQDFSTLLDELIARAEIERKPVAAPSLAADLLGVMAAAPGLASGGAREAEMRYLQSAEREAMEDQAVEVLESIVVIEPPSIEPGDIARELSLGTAGLDLDRVRRDFARSNHPDRVDASLRERAIIRMQIANHLIDEAKRRNPRS